MAAGVAQSVAAKRKPARPGASGVQVPFDSLKPSATFKVGKYADWVLIAGDSVWTAGTNPYTVNRIDPATNSITARIRLQGEACSGLVSAFDSIWIPICGKHPGLARISTVDGTLTKLPIGEDISEASITASTDSIWMMTDVHGTLSRIDPATNAVRQKIQIPAGSYNPLFSDGTIWVTGYDTNVLTGVDAISGQVIASVPVGPKPRFLTSGAGSIWTFNQGDGSVSRVDAISRKVTATIQTGMPGSGGDICYGAGPLWVSMRGLPLTQIDIETNSVVRQWVGRGGDAVRIGFDSIWLTDYYRGLLWRIAIPSR